MRGFREGERGEPHWYRHLQDSIVGLSNVVDTESIYTPHSITPVADR